MSSESPDINIYDGNGNGPVAVKPASTAAIATDPALVVSLSPNSLPLSVQGAIIDRSAMVAGAQPGLPIIGQSSGVGRIISVNRMGNIITGYQTLLALDVIEGTNINSWLWTQSTTTMTIAQTTGVLTLNSGAITTTTTSAIITSNKQLPIINQAETTLSFKASISQTTNAVQELGFGAPVGTTAIINNGAFFRISSSSTIHVVTSFNGTETVSASLSTLSTTSYYIFEIAIGDNGARFIIEDDNGIPLVDTSQSYPLTIGQVSSTSHLPAFARVYTSGAAGAAPQIKIASFQAWQYGINTSRDFSSQLAGAGRNSNINPTTFAQTAQLAAAAAPTTSTPANTTCAYTTLGGEFSLNSTASSENLLGVFGFQAPSPYQLNITDLQMNPPIVTTVLTATANIQEWCLMVASSNNPSAATGQRYPLGIFTAAASAAVGTVYNGQPLIKNFTTPIVVLPGQFLLVLVKMISGAASGVYRGSIFVNGFWE